MIIKNRLTILASLLLILLLTTQSVELALGNTAVFINEIHYDNTGTDAGEAVEIAGPAGTDLTGWSLVLYNGSGGAPYFTSALSGSIPNLDNGFGVVAVNYPSGGLQNGSPDGLALVDAGSTVVQFLSYEGSFSAVGGPANGQTSTDIGVLEDSNTPTGFSLQLIGSGSSYDDFAWTAAQANTFGAGNTGQTFVGGPSAPELTLNEIVVSTASTDQEFFEIVGAAGVSLNDVYFLEVTSGGVIDAVLDLSGGVIPASGFWAATSPEAELDLGFVGNFSMANNTLTNSSQTYLLAFQFTGASGNDIDGNNDGVIDNTLWTSLLDNVAVVAADAPVIYSANVVGPDGAFLGAGGYRCPDGNGGWNLHAFGDSANYTPGAANVCTVALPTVVINEIDYDQPSTDTAEFVELKNNGNSSVNLDNFTLELVNGTGTLVYQSIDLPNVSLASGDYFVVCANAATVPNCDLDVSPDTNLVQNGAPDAVGLRFDGTLIDAVSYEGNTGAPYTEGSGVGLEDAGLDGSISRCDDGTDTNQNNVDFVFTGITPGSANNCTPPPPPEACGDPFTPIYTVQGSGPASPLIGMVVSIEGVVVGDFQNNASTDNGNLNGFHVQDPVGDGDVATSDGIFVFAPAGMDVAIGEKVRVRGSVSEFNGLTEITASQIWQCSTGNSVTPTQVSLPVTSVDDFERYEGMLVTFPQALYISEYFNFDRFNEIVLTSERHLTPSAEFEPGPAAIQAAQEFLLDKITLDDGRTNQNPDPAIHPNGGIFDLNNLFRGGDTVQNVTGVMDYSFNLYRIQPTQGAIYTNANPRTSQPDGVGGNLKVASFNVLNYFTTLDNSGPICGPAQNQDCRGADDATEFTRQRDKIIAALTAINADVVGLIEIENHPGDIPTADLVSGLNDMLGAGTYDYIATGAIGSDAIRVALIYKPATVTPVGAYAILDSSVDSRFLDDYNRPTLAQSFQDNTTGGVFTVAVNHLKSKGSDCNAIGDPDLGNGAGNCNLTRTAAAEALVDWLASDPTGSGDGDVLIIGDLNSYDKEDPIDAIVAGGYTDLIYNFLGEAAYSYVFDGQLGYLDHGLANANLLDETTGVTVWHINADEPDLIDYDTSFKGPNQDAIYAPDAYRSSDHDPVIVGLDVCDEIAPTLEVSVSPDTLWPANHKLVSVAATVTAADNFDPNPTITLVSVTSSEPDDGLGDGDTANDIEIVDDFNFKLRAERSGTGEGRTYTITYQVTDGCGNVTEASATVTVPHSNGKKKATEEAVNDSVQPVDEVQDDAGDESSVDDNESNDTGDGTETIDEDTNNGEVAPPVDEESGQDDAGDPTKDNNGQTKDKDKQK